MGRALNDQEYPPECGAMGRGLSFSNCLVLIKCGFRIWWRLSLRSLWQRGCLPSGEMNQAIRLQRAEELPLEGGRGLRFEEEGPLSPYLDLHLGFRYMCHARVCIFSCLGGWSPSTAHAPFYLLHSVPIYADPSGQASQCCWLRGSSCC